MLEIQSNGSKWAGQQPDSIDTLLNTLGNYTLDPTFEKYGNFITKNEEGITHFFGNFLTLSHVFNIKTDEEEIISKLTKAIIQNQQSLEYIQAR